MIGAIVGDIVGSRFEWNNIKTKDFELFDLGNPECGVTDDSILSLAIANALMRFDDKKGYDYLSRCTITELHSWGEKYRYPIGGYGGMFKGWLDTDSDKPYGSFGNGSAMRVSACGWVAKTIEEVKKLSYAVTCVTHNHPEGLKGAEATALAVFLARQGKSKEEIRTEIAKNYYSLDFTLDAIRPFYKFNGSCQGTVPQALVAFFESTSFEDAIRNAISIGGDSDTIGAITGAVAGAYYDVPEDIREQAQDFMDHNQLITLWDFEEKFCGRA